MLSPDGRRVAYWHRVGDTERRTLIVMCGREAAWSRDGALSAYVDREIYVVPTADRLSWRDTQTSTTR